MKQHLLPALLIVATLWSCKKEDSNNNDPNIPWNIEMTALYTQAFTSTNVEDNKFIFELAGDGTVDIDWGDGAILTGIPLKLSSTDRYQGQGKEFAHVYDKVGTYQIKITQREGDITLFYCNNNRRNNNDDNKYSTIRFNRCPLLETLTFTDGLISSLDASGCSKLKNLDCRNNRLTSLQLDACSELADLNCSGNQLTSLDLSKHAQLKNLFCSNNPMTSLNIDGCQQLLTVTCSHNQLTSLNITQCPVLKEIDCTANQLTAINISQCSALKILNCANNQLTSLDVSLYTQLKVLYCHGNPLSTSALNKIYYDLPTWFQSDYPLNEWDEYGYLKVNRNTPGNYFIAQNKGWRVAFN